MTRSVWIGFIAGFIYLMYKILEKPKLVLLYSIVIAIILVILFYWSGGNTQIERRISQDTGSIRLLVMYSGLKMFISQPIIGVGFNRFDELNKTFFTNTFGIRFYSNHLITSHQTIVTFLAELGLIGTVLFLVFFCKAVVQVFRVSNNVSSEIEFSIQAFMLVFIINAMLIDMRFFTIAYSLLFMALGITHKYRNIILSNKKS
jgi:O-antigen ligase